MALIPESRKDDGLLFLRSSLENATLSRLGALSTAGIVRRRRERRAGREVLERCGVRGASFSAPVSALSGGNQQKVLLARVLLCRPDVVIADEPTAKLDPATAEDIVRSDPSLVAFLGTDPTVSTAVENAVRSLFDSVDGVATPVVSDPVPPMLPMSRALDSTTEEPVQEQEYDTEEKALDELPWLTPAS